MVKEVVFPLLSMRASVLLGISTLLGADNIYSKMLNAREVRSALMPIVSRRTSSGSSARSARTISTFSLEIQCG